MGQNSKNKIKYKNSSDILANKTNERKTIIEVQYNQPAGSSVLIQRRRSLENVTQEAQTEQNPTTPAATNTSVSKLNLNIYRGSPEVSWLKEIQKFLATI